MGVLFHVEHLSCAMGIICSTWNIQCGQWGLICSTWNTHCTFNPVGFPGVFTCTTFVATPDVSHRFVAVTVNVCAPAVVNVTGTDVAGATTVTGNPPSTVTV